MRRFFAGCFRILDAPLEQALSGGERDHALKLKLLSSLFPWDQSFLSSVFLDPGLQPWGCVPGRGSHIRHNGHHPPLSPYLPEVSRKDKHENIFSLLF